MPCSIPYSTSPLQTFRVGPMIPPTRCLPSEL
ncbi:hypothetical protein JMJ77_0006592 [Colletotrichum scovillei]|uniref:Uncharacterized protein n=1 Tax=Colletotrichum scovillei TaxID=1209932 RepID=A0A9P7RLG9_9PEZI|nr:hypothetical protein JMJ77_0006592 [Colletotrichum scovillei]KAG7077771.1 hypothetical protein JMJ76_0015014 [Colletotrichum scovillei]KAG7084865.1 hypothetical protein JMJ78_0010296 [Colletotrichum scovillei]